MNVTLLVVEDDLLLRDCLVEFLASQPDFKILGTAADGQEVLQALPQLRPDVLLLDLWLPGLSGMKLLQCLTALAEAPPVLVFSGDESDGTQLEAARNGARGFLPKSQGAAGLPDAIRAVARGELWFDRHICEQMWREYPQLVRRIREQEQPANPLSEREREVLLGVARGMTNSQIAGTLHMSIHTVKLHVQHILRKLNLPNRTEAAVFAVREGLLELTTSSEAAVSSR